MSYDPTCYLCPGNRRANGEVNPDYERALRQWFDPSFTPSAGQDLYAHDLYDEDLHSDYEDADIVGDHGAPVLDMDQPELRNLRREGLLGKARRPAVLAPVGELLLQEP